MGGSGSGNRSQSGRATCEGAKRIDIRYMAKRGFLSDGYYGRLSWNLGGEPVGNINFRTSRTHVELIYRTRAYGEEWTDVRETVLFGYSHQHFGGIRRWFICPKCRRRCAVLYGGALFRCRKCHGLVYQSTREDAGSRLFSRARKLRQWLGEDGGIDDPWPEKPKGMHWKTYNRKIDQIDDLETKADAHMSVYLRRLAELEGFFG